MRNSRKIITRVAIALSALLLVSAIGLAQVTVSLPNVTYKVGTTQAIPITVGDLTGLGAISYQFTVTYDTAIVSVSGVTTTGTLAAALNPPTVNALTPGQITVVAAGTSAMSGAGTLLYLNATMRGKGTTALTFSSFQFNEGTPAVTLTNGSVVVPTLSVAVSNISTTAPVGGTFTLPVTTESLTGGNVISYQFTVKFDTTKIKLTGVTIAGTMSSAFSTQVNTNVSGQMTVVGAGSTALTGTGTLIILNGVVVGGGTSLVQFTSFQFNEGTPAGAGVDGSVIVGTPVKPTLVSRVPTVLTTSSQNNIVAFTVHAKDLAGLPLTFTWRVNGAIVKGPGPDSTYSVRFTDPHGTAKTVSCLYMTTAGLSDSTYWQFTITGVNDLGGIPSDFALGQNYPNPFNPSTLISFSMPKEAPVTFEIYNLLGVKVRTLMAGEMKSAGSYTISWDGRDDRGVSMPTGVYLYRINAGTFLASKKMTLLK